VRCEPLPATRRVGGEGAAYMRRLAIGTRRPASSIIESES
jgi:hypothetical protein